MADLHLELSTTVLGTPDPKGLAAFYRDLLGWTITTDEDDWVVLRPADDGTGLAFQLEEHHAHPSWPAEPGEQQMQLHLDIQVSDMMDAVRRAEELGAAQAAYQPQDDVRVMIDPAGHPFCLFES
jgi:catechol 2,3-dioxygenase-like lactoylglutathione lyase family enzyme